MASAPNVACFPAVILLSLSFSSYLLERSIIRLSERYRVNGYYQFRVRWVKQTVAKSHRLTGSNLSLTDKETSTRSTQFASCFYKRAESRCSCLKPSFGNPVTTVWDKIANLEEVFWNRMEQMDTINDSDNPQWNNRIARNTNQPDAMPLECKAVLNVSGLCQLIHKITTSMEIAGLWQQCIEPTSRWGQMTLKPATHTNKLAHSHSALPVE